MRCEFFKWNFTITRRDDGRKCLFHVFFFFFSSSAMAVATTQRHDRNYFPRCCCCSPSYEIACPIYFSNRYKRNVYTTTLPWKKYANLPSTIFKLAKMAKKKEKKKRIYWKFYLPDSFPLHIFTSVNNHNTISMCVCVFSLLVLYGFWSKNEAISKE